MFEEVVYEVCHEPFKKDFKSDPQSAFMLSNSVANVCAFLDCYFQGNYILISIFEYNMFILKGPSGDVAPESDRIRYTRHKWAVIHKEHYIPYAIALEIPPMKYEDFVRTRRKQRYALQYSRRCDILDSVDTHTHTYIIVVDVID